LETGATISVNQFDSILTYQVHFRNIPKGNSFKLVGTIDHNIVYRATVRNADSIFVHSFSTKEMPRGLLRLSLFDNEYRAISERICFLFPTKHSGKLVDSVQMNFDPRSLNLFTVKTDSTEASVTVVRDFGFDDPDAGSNLETAFWLAGLQSVQIKNASKYFDGTEKGSGH